MSEPSLPPTNLEESHYPTPTPPSGTHEGIDHPTNPVSLRSLPDSEDNLPAAAEPTTNTPLTAGRTQLGAEIARGGMGAVLRGRDPDLNREVAVKVLLEAHRDRPECARRFLEEAQIGGQLQHPGTVPVYELGQLDDGRPFFTMKLVKGHTLAKLLARRATPQEELPRFLSIFEQVCQTLAYAHARGVIHRDLKPANIMVGHFGEVQVMDWGMAKVLGRVETVSDIGPALPTLQEDSTVIQTLRTESNTEPSRAGTMMGTPAFIPPEQAKGEIDLIDERADVFGLGAILCVILTGQPPYTGSLYEVMEKAGQGEVADAYARLEECGADAELIELCKQCLAAERDQRPREAGAVATRLAEYQAGVQQRLRRAELESATARARAVEERKRHQLTAALALAVLGIVLVVAGSGIWLERKNAELKRQAVARKAEEAKRLEDIDAALNKVDGLQQNASWDAAQAVLEAAQARLDETGPPELRQRLEATRARLDLVRRLDAIRLERAAYNEAEFRFDERQAAGEYARAFQEAGLGTVGQEEASVASRIRQSAIRTQLIAALDDWALVADGPAQRAWVLEVARLADEENWRNRFRDPAVWQDKAALIRLTQQTLADEAKVAVLTPQLLNTVAKELPRENALALLKAGQQRNPTDFWLNLLLGTRLLDVRKAGEAVGYLQAALAIRPQIPVVYLNLGKALANAGRQEEALAHYHTALRLDSRFALAHYNLGTLLHDKGQLDDAMREYRTAIDLNPRISGAYVNLGNALRDSKRAAEAVFYYRQASLLKPRNVLTYNGLGLALGDLDRGNEAIQAFCTAIHFNQAPTFTLAERNLGTLLHEMGRLEESVASFQRALARNPKDAASLAYLGRTLLALERFDQARDATRRALQYLPSNAPEYSEIKQQLQRCEYLHSNQDRVPALLRRESPPRDNAERLLLAVYCQEDKRYFATAAHFYAAAFAEDPTLAADLKKSQRYNAACVAAKASCGKGADAASLNTEERARLRQQALAWLRAELTLWEKEAARPKERALVRAMLSHWQQDSDLMGLRERKALQQLPAAEREDWCQLWADVRGLLMQLKDQGGQ